MSYWYDSIAVGVLGKMRYSAILYANTDRQKYELLRIVIWSTVAESYPMRLDLNFNKRAKFFHFSTFSFIRRKPRSLNSHLIYEQVYVALQCIMKW